MWVNLLKDTLKNKLKNGDTMPYNQEDNTPNIILITKRSGHPASSRIDVTHRIIHIYDIIDSYISSGIISFLPFLIDESESEPITIKISTIGGDVNDLLSLIYEFNKLSCPIITEITGIAYSAGALLASVGDERIVSKYGELMYHYPVWAVPFDIGMKEHGDIVRRTKDLYDRLLTDVASQTTLSFKEFTGKFLTTDWYVTPKEALKYNLVTKVI
jgi:ATP-dependent protease ClpP protease subunit